MEPVHGKHIYTKDEVLKIKDELGIPKEEGVGWFLNERSEYPYDLRPISRRQYAPPDLPE